MEGGVRMLVEVAIVISKTDRCNRVCPAMVCHVYAPSGMGFQRFQISRVPPPCHREIPNVSVATLDYALAHCVVHSVATTIRICMLCIDCFALSCSGHPRLGSVNTEMLRDS